MKILALLVSLASATLFAQTKPEYRFGYLVQDHGKPNFYGYNEDTKKTDFTFVQSWILSSSMAPKGAMQSMLDCHDKKPYAIRVKIDTKEFRGVYSNGKQAAQKTELPIITEVKCIKKDMAYLYSWRDALKKYFTR